MLFILKILTLLLHRKELIELTEFVFEEVTDKVLSGFNNTKLVACPTCRAILDLIIQDLESDSDFYECANCGFKIKRSIAVTISK